MSEAADRLRQWATEVEEAYADGGYASGDGPAAPLDEALAVLAENERLTSKLVALNVCVECDCAIDPDPACSCDSCGCVATNRED